MGSLWILFRIDNALLAQLASPGVTLTATYEGDAVASSMGSRGLEPVDDAVNAQLRTIGWRGDTADPVQVTIRGPVKMLFTTAEVAMAVSVIPVLDGLILWFALGTWLMRQTRRINALGEAVRASSGEEDEDEGTGRDAVLAESTRPSAHGRPEVESSGLHDEIDAVAETLRRTNARREQAEQRIVKLNDDLKLQNAQLEAVNSELESFIYSVSHDLRAPLRSIAGYSSILMEDYGDRIDATGGDYLNRISAGAARMSERMDDLLYLSRISRQEMACIEVDLSAMAKTIVAELRESDPERKVEVVIADGIVAFADPRLMAIALSNIISNAWKFTQRTVEPRIELGTLESHGRVIFWVRDNGAGFDPGLVQRMFMPFHRLHSESEFEGTGLGLAIVERVIRRHGGRVWAQGAVDKGATIHFTL
jgi:signal transduction histidine kinase